MECLPVSIAMAGKYSELRRAVNLCGVPPLADQEIIDYRKSFAACETIVGAGLLIQLPTGESLEDKLTYKLDQSQSG